MCQISASLNSFTEERHGLFRPCFHASSYEHNCCPLLSGLFRCGSPRQFNDVRPKRPRPGQCRFQNTERLYQISAAMLFTSVVSEMVRHTRPSRSVSCLSKAPIRMLEGSVGTRTKITMMFLVPYRYIRRTGQSSHGYHG